MQFCGDLGHQVGQFLGPCGHGSRLNVPVFGPPGSAHFY